MRDASIRSHLQRLLEHMRWADRRILERMAAGSENAEALRLLAHLLGSERVWLGRLRGDPAVGSDSWRPMTLEECVVEAAETHAAYARLLEELPEEVSGEITYRNSQGIEFNSAIQDVLSHVFLHGSYHRGQIVRSLREAGEEPVNTDFITFAREGGGRADA